MSQGTLARPYGSAQCSGRCQHLELPNLPEGLPAEGQDPHNPGGRRSDGGDPPSWPRAHREASHDGGPALGLLQGFGQTGTGVSITPKGGA